MHLSVKTCFLCELRRGIGQEKASLKKFETEQWFIIQHKLYVLFYYINSTSGSTPPLKDNKLRFLMPKSGKTMNFLKIVSCFALDSL